MNDLNNIKHIQVPMIVMQDETLSTTTKLFMGLINSLSMQKGYCYASNKYLSDFMKVSKRTITSLITTLKNKNYIKTINDNNVRKIYLANFY